MAGVIRVVGVTGVMFSVSARRMVLMRMAMVRVAGAVAASRMIMGSVMDDMRMFVTGVFHRAFPPSYPCVLR
jgi:uncharacterized membrane protein YdcZ (DUF606 family)